MLFQLILFLIAITFTGPMFAEKKVVVVGAGLAGLTTAYRLHQQGINVEVYEARNRVGGRVLSVHLEGSIGELGGQNITDGGDAVNMLRLIHELDLELNERTFPLHSSYFNGDDFLSIDHLLKKRKFDPEKLKKELEELAITSKNMREVFQGIFEESDPLYKVMAVRLAGYEGGPLEKLSPLYTETLYHMLLGGISAAHQGGEEENIIHLASIKGGNSLLPEKMARSLGDNVHLNKTLKKVSKKSKGIFILTFQDGKEISADILVLAIPCSVYKDIIFENNVIPTKFLEPIQHIHYGENSKILIKFQDPPVKAVGLFNDQMGSFFADHEILTLYYTGSSSEFNPQTIQDSYNRNREMIEKGYRECPLNVQPLYAKDKNFGKYQGAVGYSWPQDPYVKGSYSYIAAGQENLMSSLKEVYGEQVKELFAPIENLYFVGEHASILMDTPGTMEAACESGERIGRIIKNLNKF